VNILFTIRYFYPFIGGTEKQALALAAQLVKKGVTVTIVTSRFESKWSQQEVMDGVKVIRLFSPRIKIAGALFFLASLTWYLIKKRNHYSQIHTFQIGYTSSLSILMGILLNKPSLLKLASSGRGGDLQRARKTLWGRVFLFMAKKASRIIMVSKTVEQELMAERVNPEKLCRISNGVNLKSYDKEKNKVLARKTLKIPDRKTVIYTGRLSPEKGIDFLLRCFSKVAQSTSCQLIIIAEGPEKKHIMKRIDQLALSHAIRVLPRVDEIAPYLKAADLFVLPSQFEGLSNSLLEAMACGLPVISTKVGGSIDIIENRVNGLLVEYGDEDGLSQAISQVLGDSDLAVNLGNHARETVEEKQDIDRIAEQYSKVYSSFINKMNSNCEVC
jgi:glycosyltransferase involved in cell wall biosynthesis